jgi:hypothetical protein
MFGGEIRGGKQPGMLWTKLTPTSSAGIFRPFEIATVRRYRPFEIATVRRGHMILTASTII